MWIAKPIGRLNENEIHAYQTIAAGMDDFPISQSLIWANAIENLGSKTFAVFNLEKKCAGMVYESAAGVFECINGPIFNWQNQQDVASQLATFAMAVTKLSSNFKKMELRPRWLLSELDQKLKCVPIQPTEILSASTWIVPVEQNFENQFNLANKRLQRTFKKASPLATVRIDPILDDSLDRFVELLKSKAEEKNYVIPPKQWFSAFKDDRFFKVLAESRFSKTELMIGVQGRRAHYLFGATEHFEKNSQDSTSTAAHFKALDECRRLGLVEYDLNGYVQPHDSSHSYAGVANYKKQFGGGVREYVQAIFVIE